MTKYNQVTPEIAAQLQAIVGAKRFFAGDAVKDDFSHDEMPIYGKYYPEVVCEAESTEEVSAILRVCYDNNIPVTPRGAGTGLVGGCVPLCGGVVLCTTRMNKILSYDMNNLVVHIQPGVLLCDLAADALTHGLMYPPDPGEKTSTVGGNVSTNAGGMRAVIKLDAAQVENLAAQAGEDCWPVNYNSPQQTVVAGAPDALQTLDVLVKEAGGRAMKVAVSGAFHSPYMAEATCGLAAYIEAGHAPSPLLIPVLANMTAAPYPADPQTASDVLANQVSHAVRWVDTLHALQDQGIDTFIEVGPGKTLSSLVKRTLSDVRVYSCETAEQVAAIADELA